MSELKNYQEMHNDREIRPLRTYCFDIKYKNRFLEEIEVMAKNEIIAENRVYDIARSEITVELIEEVENDL